MPKMHSHKTRISSSSGTAALQTCRVSSHTRAPSKTSVQPLSSCNTPFASLPASQPHPHACQLKVAAAAPDTLLEAAERAQEPSIEFLGVFNDMQTVRGVLETVADPDLVYNLLTDYDSCSRVFRNISGSQTLFTDQGDKQVLQACKWQFLAFKGTFNVHLNVSEAPEDRLLVFTLAESSFMRDFEGRWQVTAGTSGGSRVEHVLAVKPLVSIPAAVAPYTSSIFKSQVAALLQDLQAEIDRQITAAAAADN